MNSFQTLKETAALSDNDLLLIYDQKNGDARSISLSLLLAWFENNTAFVASRFDPAMLYEAVFATGFTVTIPDTELDTQLVVISHAAYLTGTLVLPGNPEDQQEVWYFFTETVSTLTLNGNGASVKYPAAIAAAGYMYKRKYDATSNTWYHY